MPKRPNNVHCDEDAERIALLALRFLAEDGARLGRFLSLTGLGPDELRASAGERHVLAAVLGHILEDESLLLLFVGNHGLPPEDIGGAHRLLGGGTGLGPGEWPQ